MSPTTSQAYFCRPPVPCNRRRIAPNAANPPRNSKAVPASGTADDASCVVRMSWVSERGRDSEKRKAFSDALNVKAVVIRPPSAMDEPTAFWASPMKLLLRVIETYVPLSAVDIIREPYTVPPPRSRYAETPPVPLVNETMDVLTWYNWNVSGLPVPYSTVDHNLSSADMIASDNTGISYTKKL